MKIRNIEQKIKQMKIYKWFQKVTNSKKFLNFVVKAVVSFVIMVVAFIPSWLYLIIRWFISPEGFWQEFAIFVIAAIVVGWLQVILAVIAGIICFTVIFAEI